MKSKFEYVLIGVFITLITLVGVFSFVLNQAQAGDEVSNDSTMSVSEQSLNETSEILDVDSPNDEIPAKEPAQMLEQVTTPIEDKEEIWIQSDDPKVVLEMLKGLNHKQADNLLGQEGWMSITVTGPELHEIKDVSVNDYHGPDGQIVPAEALRPLGSSIVNEWYYVNKNGLVEKGLTYTTDEYNQVYGQSILQDGAWASVTLKMHDFPEEIYIVPAQSNQLNSYLPIQQAIQFLEVTQMVDKSVGETKVTSYEENGRYPLIVYYSHVEPVDLGWPFPEPVIAGERHFVFDGINGYLLSDTHNFTLQSGEPFLAGIAEYYTSPLFPQLPNDVQQLFDESQQLVTEK